MSGIFKPLFGTPLNRDHPLAQGMQVCWLLNENTGLYAYDSSGLGNHGTLINMADPPTPTSGWGAGPHGGALAFDGSNDYGVCGQSPGIINQVTFEIWLRATQTEHQYLNYPISLGNNGAQRLGLWVGGYYQDAQTAQQSIGLFDGSVSSSAVTKCFTDDNDANICRHIVAVYDDTANPKTRIYKDSISLAMFSNNITGNIAAQNQVNIGRRVDNNWYWKGFIEKSSIYNRALSAKEISDLYHDLKCMFEEPGLPAWRVPGASADNYYRRVLAGGC